MRPAVRNTVLGCVAFMSVVVGLFVFNMLREPVLSDAELREQGVVVLPKPREVVPFELTDHRGRAFSREDLEGEWTFAYFGFTHCPDICPVSLSVMAEARREIAAEHGESEAFRGLLVSVDPERDTPDVLAEYLASFHPDFVGVTGDVGTIGDLARQAGVYFQRAPNAGRGGDYLVDHMGHIVVYDPRGHQHAYIRTPHTVDQLVSAWRNLEARF